MNIHEMILREKKRSDSYRFLSACFCQPQKDIFLEEKMLRNLTMNLELICPEAAVFAAMMEKNIHQYSNLELAVEYARLFIGPFEVKAPPYGSIYLDGERRVMGDSTMEVIRQYEDAGLSGDKEFHDLPDHIAVELEFMSFLVYKEIEAMEKTNVAAALEMLGKQERFLDGFLVRWITPFCVKITERTDNDFYAALANCTENFVKSVYPGMMRDALSDGALTAS